MSKKSERIIIRDVEFGEGGEHIVLPKYDMTRDTKMFRNMILTPISLVFNPIPNEIAKTRSWF